MPVIITRILEGKIHQETLTMPAQRDIIFDTPTGRAVLFVGTPYWKSFSDRTDLHATTNDETAPVLVTVSRLEGGNQGSFHVVWEFNGVRELNRLIPGQTVVHPNGLPVNVSRR